MEDLIELNNNLPVKTDSFSKLQNRPDITGKTSEALQLQYSFTRDKPDLRSYLLTSMERYQRLLSELKALEEEIGTLELSPPPVGGDTFVTMPKPIGLPTDTPGDTGYRSYEGSYVGGGSLLVAESGSLAVTRLAIVVGAREKFGVVATRREDLSEARAVNGGCLEGEVGVAGTQTTPGNNSGYYRQRYVIVPQGSILSVTLFAIRINSIVKNISPGVECSLSVDDFVICYRSQFIHIIEQHLQRSLYKLQEWTDLNGFKFSRSKTVCVHFCHLRKVHPGPVLLSNGTPIPVGLVEQTKFFGLVFDKNQCNRKLSFVPHLQYLRKKCMKALKLLRVVAHSRWDSDENTLLHLYRSLIRSKLDYGAIVYDSARKSYLRILDPVQNQVLRLCL